MESPNSKVKKLSNDPLADGFQSRQNEKSLQKMRRIEQEKEILKRNKMPESKISL